MEEKVYRPINREEHTTDNPDAVINAIKEAYPESEGFYLEFEVVDAQGPIKARGSKTVIVDIYKDDKYRKTF
ncbi:MAG: hypothetical protein IJH20_00905 [Bacilli bacterium]|nr:hypothetical protein [Bacilli bacterium]